MKKFMMLLCLISMGDLYAKAKPKDKFTEATTELKTTAQDGIQQVQTTAQSELDTKKSDKQADKSDKQADKQAARKQMLEENKTEVTAGMDLRKKDLKRYRFSQPNLQNIIMDSTTKNEKGSTDNEDGTSTQEDVVQFDLSQSNYNGVHAADLSGADLATADLSMFNLDGVRYDKNTKLPTTLTAQQKNSMKIISEIIATHGMDLKKQNLDLYYFRGRDISGIAMNIDTTSTKIVDFSDANATGSIFSGVDLSKPTALFIKTILVNADMSLGTFIGNDFSDANMQNVNMSGSNCTNAKFKNTQMQNANFTTYYWTDVKANIVYSFSTNLTNADFSNADLTDADLTEANVTGAIFTGAKYNANTKLPATMTPAQKASMVLVK